MSVAATDSASAARGPGWAWALLLASGFAGLGYQIVWTQQGALWLGQESASVLAVVSAFFGGQALGAGALGERIANSARPARAYALCEAVIGLWSLALALFGPQFGEGLLQAIGPRPDPAWQWAVAFAGSFVLLLPATAAMGATLPAMERALGAARTDRGEVAGLYAANTLGAVLGVLASAFWLIPTLGLLRTAVLCALLNLVCAVVSGRLAWGAVPQRRPREPERWRVLAVLAATGLLGIGYEVLAVRALSQVTENTVYTFALVLAVYLMGTALGAAAWQRWGRAGGDAAVGPWLLQALALGVALGGGSLWAAEGLKAVVSSAAGTGPLAALGAEAALALAALGPPTLAMGALFSHLCQSALRQGVPLGWALAANTLGGALAPALIGVLLLPATGTKAAVLLIAAAYALLGARHAVRKPMSGAGVVAVLAVVAVMALALSPLVLVTLPEGARLLSHREGATAAVSLVEDARGSVSLHIDNHAQEGSNATRLADGRQALLPLLLHPAPQRALFLGLGTGVTAATAALGSTAEVDAVELVPEVIEASERFIDELADGHPLPGLQRRHADARRFVRTSPLAYDVIVADNVHPARSGSALLYTVEHFQAVRGRLAPDGLFCQWLPLHQMDLDTLRSVVRSFMTVFPQGGALLATFSLETPVLGLVARSEGQRFDFARLQAPPVPRDERFSAQAYGLADGWAVAGSVVAGPRALARFAGDAPFNTDDRPVVAYRAPGATYAPEALPRERLLSLLLQLDLAPDELFERQSPAEAQRLAAYWAARNHFLDAGRDVRPVADVRQMLAQVREPLLQVLRISPDFRPAYDPLLRMAEALGPRDADGARALLTELQQRAPARPEAAALLARLGPP